MLDYSFVNGLKPYNIKNPLFQKSSRLICLKKDYICIANVNQLYIIIYINNIIKYRYYINIFSNSSSSSCIQSLKSIEKDNKFYIYTVDTFCNIALTIIQLPESINDLNNNNISSDWKEFPSNYLINHSIIIYNNIKINNNWIDIAINQDNNKLCLINSLEQYQCSYNINNSNNNQNNNNSNNQNTIFSRLNNIPKDVCFLDNNITSILEGNFVSLYDHRSSTSKYIGRYQCSQSTSENLLTLCISHNYNSDYHLYSAGTEKTVLAIDTRTWKSLIKYKTSCKYPIIKLLSSYYNYSNSNEYVYVAGHDNELLRINMTLQQQQPTSSSSLQHGNGHDYSKKQRKRPLSPNTNTSTNISKVNENTNKFSKGIRGFSNWGGLDIIKSYSHTAKESEIIYGFCNDKSTLYRINDANYLSVEKT